MVITLYKYSSEPNRLDKTAYLSAPIYGIDCTIKGTFTTDAPELLLSFRGDLSGYNYGLCTFNGQNNYYYVRIAGEIGGKIRAICTRDPLMTFKTGVLALPIKADRCEQRADDVGIVRGFNAFLPDPNRQILQTTLQRRLVVDSMEWQPTRILVTVG